VQVLPLLGKQLSPLLKSLPAQGTSLRLLLPRLGICLHPSCLGQVLQIPMARQMGKMSGKQIMYTGPV
jgi:hypothetical protein